MIAKCLWKPLVIAAVGYMAAQSALADATKTTQERNSAVLELLDFSDRRDFENANRGFIAKMEPAIIKDADGNVIWDQEQYSFLSEDAPDTANPSLWRQGQLNAIHGLFKVTDGIYQLRGYDLANVTLVEGDTGWILIDPVLTNEAARAALDLANEHLGERPLSAMIYTHSHADHFGGARGVMDQAQENIRIIAPNGFMEYAVAENIMVGNTMARRSSFQFGNVVPKGPDGQIGTGLGQTTSTGSVSLIPPTELITETGTVLTVDGVEIVFQMANGSEAPSEFMFYFPQHKALCLSEVTSHVLHNVYTLRGAKMRDALGWSKYINETIQMFGEEVEVAFASHHWPTWGNAEINEYLEAQRDIYRFIHDETLRLTNHGYGPREIANMIELPDVLARNFATRGYYGSLKHNSEAVYNFYLGWFDGNPANLDRHTPVESGKRYVAAMGGADALLSVAQNAYDAGDYRWVAELVNHLIFADPENEAALELQAKAMTQLGFQAESGVWRNVYLAAAQELRNGVVPTRAPQPGPDTVAAMSLDMFFDFLGVKLNPKDAEGEHLVINFDFPDQGEKFMLELKNSVLNNTKGIQAEDPNVSLTITRDALNKLILKQAGFPRLVLSGDISFDGNPLAFRKLMGMMEDFDPWFPIVTP